MSLGTSLHLRALVKSLWKAAPAASLVGKTNLALIAVCPQCVVIPVISSGTKVLSKICLV
eukprot:1854132-Alexandrium_andersonii.AAC.1